MNPPKRIIVRTDDVQALARAIYSRPEIALFDDIFSGLDNHTARTVFQRVFSADEGMLRAWGTSIVLATQSGTIPFQSSGPK